MGTRLAWLVGAVACGALGFAACVGDAPNIADGGTDGASDGSLPPEGGGDDAAATDGSADAGPCANIQGCPTTIQSWSLEVWLRGDVGVQCDTAVNPARVTLWLDQSGKARHARPVPNNPGPRCGPNGEMLNGTNVPAFRPSPLDASFYKNEETLRLDLQFLQTGVFTLFVVERRGDARTSQTLLSEQYQGTVVGCDGGAPYFDLFYLVGGAPPGTVSYRSAGCTQSSALGSTYMPTDKAVLVEVVSTGSLLRVYRNGVAGATSDASAKMVLQPNIGVIGNGHDPSFDNRYYGAIPEIIAYSMALSDPDRLAVEGYVKSKWGLVF